MEKFKPAIKYGVYFGLASIAIFLLMYALVPIDSMGTPGVSMISGVVTVLALPIVFMILGARDCKPNFNPNTYGKAFKAAFLVGLFSVLLGFAFNLFFNYVIDSEYEGKIREQVLERTYENLERASMPQDQIETSMERTKKFMDWQQSFLGKLISYGGFLLWYTILALLIAIVYKEKSEPLIKGSGQQRIE